MRHSSGVAAQGPRIEDLTPDGDELVSEPRPADPQLQGAVISIDCGLLPGCTYNLALLDRMRNGMYVSDSDIPIAVMAQNATAELLADLRERHISSVILKPFRAKVLLDAFASFQRQAANKL